VKHLLIVLLMYITSLNALNYASQFDHMMGYQHQRYHHYFEQLLNTPNELKTYYFFRKIFVSNHLDTVTASNTPRIPKIIHQIWLSPDEQQDIPDQFKQFRATWLHYHPDWEYKLWTNKDIEALNLENKQLYDAAINYAERSDIARYEILYRFGGLYIDVDFECLKPFDSFHYLYDFYTGLELPALAPFLRHLIILPNGLIGCKPKHPIMHACIDALKEPSLSTDIIVKTGPLKFMSVFMAHANNHDTKDIALPAQYFYPIDKKITIKEEINACITPHTYAVHHWAGSWMLKQEAFVPGIEIKSNQVGNTIHFQIVDTRSN